MLGDAARFNSYFSQDLVAKDDYYTFELLADMPEYSLLASPFLNLVGLAVFAGKPGDILRANQFVYDFTNKVLLPIASVLLKVDPVRIFDGYYANGLIQPGSITSSWKKITGYNCHVDTKDFRFHYSEFFYE
jgi:hypothetical protein